ncbi:MAG: hypothetical protein ABIG89_03995 [Candidatus Woesearchaeota archaeon]
MKTVFYFMFVFVAMLFLFGGVLKTNDINLNQELHGMAVQHGDNSQVQYDGLNDIKEKSDIVKEELSAEEHPDLILVYPYEKK